MKRKLTSEERDLTRKGIARMSKEINGYKEDIEMWMKLQKYREAKRDYEDISRPYNRQKEDKELNDAIKFTLSKIEEIKRTLEIDRKHLKEGVEQKENKAIG